MEVGVANDDGVLHVARKACAIAILQYSLVEAMEGGVSSCLCVQDACLVGRPLPTYRCAFGHFAPHGTRFKVGAPASAIEVQQPRVIAATQ